jgi:hypothetical protein
VAGVWLPVPAPIGRVIERQPGVLKVVADAVVRRIDGPEG